MAARKRAALLLRADMQRGAHLWLVEVRHFAPVGAAEVPKVGANALAGASLYPQRRSMETRQRIKGESVAVSTLMKATSLACYVCALRAEQSVHGDGNC